MVRSNHLLMNYSNRIVKNFVLIVSLTLAVGTTTAQQYKVDTIVYNGSPDKFINLVFLGDGFRAAELPVYLENARKLSNYLFSISPFSEYSHFFNVFAISVASPESGANHPGTATDESSSSNQPVASVNTTFNSTFDYASIHRLLVPQNYSAVFNAVASNAPFYDEIFMVVNSPYYGGSGSPNLATSSLNTSSYEVLVHEIGHSFAGLADEYYAGDMYAAEAPNMTQESNPNLVKWKNWIGVGGVGVYQYCCGNNSAFWYKPHQSCKMQLLGSPFCPVCREEIIKKIYDYVPALDGFSPSAQVAVNYCATPLIFKLHVNKPDPNTIKTTWRLNGIVISTNTDSLTIHTSQLNDGSNILSAIVLDTTAMIRSNLHLIDHADTITWTINNSLIVPVLTATGATTFCEGKSITLRSDADTGNRWYKDGVLIGDSTGTTFVARETGSYVVKTRLQDCESPASNAITVTATSNPQPVVTPSSGSSCSGQSIELRTVPVTGNTYQWRRAGIDITGATGASYTAAVSGSYNVVIFGADGCRSTSNDVRITIGTAPQAAIAAAGPTTFCAGKNVLLKTTLGTGYTYQWRKSGAIIAGANSSTYIADVTGIFTVQVTNVEGCSSISGATNVTVNPLPIATVGVGGSLTFCSGANVLLRATQGLGYNYQWKNNGLKIEGQTASDFTATATGIYSVEVTNATGCSTNSALFNVTANAIPAATITPNGALTFCSGKNVILRANTGTDYLYQWKRGGANIPGANNFTYTATTTGTYSVIVTNAAGCFVASVSKTVVVNPLPVATITPGGPINFCAGKDVLLKGNTGTAYTYQWKKAGINIAENSTGVNYTASVSGIYSVEVTNSYGCTVASAATTVTVNNAPLADLAAAGPTSFCSGKNVLLKAITGTGYSYRWKRSGIGLTDQTSSTYLADAPGIYSVDVINASGCTTTSAGINVTVAAAPPALIAAAGPTRFCAGKNVLLKATVGTGFNYQWKKDGINIQSQASSTFTANSTGLYSVAITNVQGCTTVSGGTNVIVNSVPLAIITPSGPLTIPQGENVVLNAPTGTGYTYQWKKDGADIYGAVSVSYPATASGNYSVVVTDANLCEASSQQVQVTVTAGRAITKSNTFLEVYPNPIVRGEFLNVHRNLNNANNVLRVTVTDISGRLVCWRLLKPDERKFLIPGKAGVYHIEIIWGVNERRVFKIIKIE